MASFPTTPIVDDFSGSLANWATLDGTGTVGAIVSGELSIETAPYHSAYHTVETFGPDSEVYCTVVTKPSADTGDIIMQCRMVSVGSSANDGYTIRYVRQAGTDQFRIGRIDNGVGTMLGEAILQELSNGDSFGLRIAGSILEGWYRSGSGAWVPLGTRTDTTYSGAGYLAVTGSTGLGTKLDNFGGGTSRAHVENLDFTSFPKPKMIGV